MELYIIKNNLGDITYSSELTPPFIHFVHNLDEGRGSIRRRPYGLRLTSLSFRKSSAH